MCYLISRIVFQHFLDFVFRFCFSIVTNSLNFMSHWENLLLRNIDHEMSSSSFRAWWASSWGTAILRRYTPASLRTSYHPPPWRSHTSVTVTHSLYELLDYALLELKPITLSESVIDSPLAPLDLFICASLRLLVDVRRRDATKVTLRFARSSRHHTIHWLQSIGSIEPTLAEEKCGTCFRRTARERYVRQIGAEISFDRGQSCRCSDRTVYSRELLSLSSLFVELDDLDASIGSLGSFSSLSLSLSIFLLTRKHALRTTQHRPTARHGTRLWTERHCDLKPGPDWFLTA